MVNRVLERRFSLIMKSIQVIYFVGPPKGILFLYKPGKI